MRKTLRMFCVFVLVVSITGLTGAMEPEMAGELLVQEGSYTAKGQVRSADVSPDGKSILIVEQQSLTMLDMTGNVMWIYVPPKEIKEGVQTYIRFAYPTFGGAAVIDLGVGDIHSDELWPYALIGIDHKGNPKWKILEVGELSVQSPTGEAILTTGRDIAHTLLIDAKTGKTLWKRKGIYGETVKFSADEKRIVISTLAEPDRTTILDENGRELWRVPFGLYEKDIAIAREGRRVVLYNWLDQSGYDRDLLLVFDSTGKEIWRKKLSVSQIEIDDLGEHILIGDASRGGGKVKLLGPSGDILWESPSSLGEWRNGGMLHVSPDGKSMAFSVQKDGINRMYCLDENLKMSKPMTLQSGKEVIRDRCCGRSVVIEGSTVKWFRRQSISQLKEGAKQ